MNSSMNLNDEKGVEAEEVEEVEVVLGDLVHLYDQEAQPDHQHHQEVCMVMQL